MMNAHDKKLQAQAILRRDPLAFFERSLASTMPNVEYLPNWHIPAMAAPVEEMLYGDDKRYVINIHPRMGKSLFFSVALPMFLLMRNPACQVMGISYAETLAGQFHQSSRLISKQKWYRELNADLKFKSAGDQASILKETGSILQTTELGYRISLSFSGSITGFGADWIILDDPNDMTQINSEAHRTKIKETFDQTIATRLNNKGGRIILVTQRGHIDDLSGHLLEKGGFKHLKIEAVATQRTIYPLGHGQTYPREKGELIDPRRFGPPEIEERRRDLGSGAFEAQYQQNPQPPEGNLFKRQWLTIVDTVPEFQYIVITGDIANSPGRGDYTAFLVWGYANEIWYLIAAHRDQRDLPGTIRFYRQLDDFYEPDKTVIESNGSGAGFVDMMNDIGYKHVDGVSVIGDKRVRAEAITPLIERKQVAFLKTMPLYDKFMEELLSFPSSKYDDMVDALTLALSHRYEILRTANYHRRPKRRHLAQAPSSQVEVRVTTFGASSGTRDSYFDRTGRSVFSR
jgi:predicted phage terminase large subunit-like protein